ncbi:SRPBCC family protein [Nocardioides sp.]|uniref:SRPBCC family protein n=1 Tax=Nocardioides sp. TaxID=35761 RepID=UPI0035620981
MHPCKKVDLDFFDSAPMTFTNTVSISLAPEELFDFLARADTWSRWAKVITDVEYTSPEPRGVGTTRVVTMRGGIVGDEEFLAWEPGVHLAFRFNSSSTSTLVAFLEDYRIVPTETGCDLTWSLAQETKGASKFLSPVTRPLTNMMFKHFLKNLQKVTAAPASTW